MWAHISSFKEELTNSLEWWLSACIWEDQGVLAFSSCFSASYAKTPTSFIFVSFRHGLGMYVSSDWQLKGRSRLFTIWVKGCWSMKWNMLWSRRKMSQYFGDISPKYRVSDHLDTIYVRDISVPRYFINLSWFSLISRDLLAFYHFIFNISRYFGRSNEDQCGQTFKNASGPSRGLEPQPKGLVGSKPTAGASLPLDI